MGEVVAPHRQLPDIGIFVQAYQTVEGNGVFQRVLLHLATRRVRLDFKPLARYAWIAHIFWLLLLFVIGFKCRLKYQGRTLEKASR